jgi:hypothetical protein
MGAGHKIREIWQRQLTAMPQAMNHLKCKDLEAIALIVDSRPTTCENILQDLITAFCWDRRIF